MKKFLLLLLIVPIIFAQNIEIKEYVNDYANLLSLSEKTEIEAIAKDIQNSSFRHHRM